MLVASDSEIFVSEVFSSVNGFERGSVIETLSSNSTLSGISTSCVSAECSELS